MKLKIGIIGAGGISRAHAAAYGELPAQTEIIAVADVQPQRAQEAAAQWGAPHAFTSHQELLALDELDAVSICTFTQAHYQPAVDALNAGKHVLVEKPMAATTDQAVAMARAARHSGKILMVDMKWRFMPEILAARQAIQNGQIGSVYYAEAIGWQHRGIPGGSFIRQDMAGGGALMDNGVYTLDALLYMLGHPKPLTVSGTAANIFGASPEGNWDPTDFSVEDFGSAYIRLEGGITLFFGHAWAINFDEQWSLRLAGNLGAVELAPFGSGPPLRIRRGSYGGLEDITPQQLPEGQHDINYAVARFIDAIQHGKPSPVPADTFLYTNVIFDALYESSRLGREVPVAVPDL